MHFKSLRWLLAVAALLAAWSAQAALIYTTSYALAGTDPTQSGRLLRNGVAQDWTGTETYPGEVTGASFKYHTFTVDLDTAMAGFTFGQYLQIEVDYGTGTGDFVSAYLDAYLPTNKSSGWLGDTGSSGNVFGNSRFFQVIAGSGHDLVLVLNSANSVLAASNVAVTINVEAFTDTAFSDLTPLTTGGTVPEPAALALVAVALVAMARARRRSRSEIA